MNTFVSLRSQFVQGESIIKKAYTWKGFEGAYITVKSNKIMLNDIYVFPSYRGTPIDEFNGSTRRFIIAPKNKIHTEHDLIRKNYTILSTGQTIVLGAPKNQKLLSGDAEMPNGFSKLNDFINIIGNSGDLSKRVGGVEVPDSDERHGFEIIEENVRHQHIIDISTNLMLYNNISIYSRVGNIFTIRHYSPYDDGSSSHAVLSENSWRPEGCFVEFKKIKNNWEIQYLLEIKNGALVINEYTYSSTDFGKTIGSTMTRLTKFNHYDHIVNEIVKIKNEIKASDIFNATDGERTHHEPIYKYDDPDNNKNDNYMDSLFGSKNSPKPMTMSAEELIAMMS